MSNNYEGHKFFKVLREYIIKFEDKKKLSPYYEALLQIANNKRMDELIKECEFLKFDINYLEENEDDYYSSGKFYVEFDNLNITHSYIINLGDQDDSSGYCECNPFMDDYNITYDCCGISCDTTFPTINIVKEEDIISHTYNGYAKDLWKDLEKWNDSYDKEIKEKERLAKVETLKSRMQLLKDEIDLLERI